MSEVTYKKWYAVEDDTIGGWCINATGNPPSMGDYYIADFVKQEDAEHIAMLHNEWLGEIDHRNQ